MRRKDIKADGTIYADVNGKPVRVVETERLWDFTHRRFGRMVWTTEPSTHGQMSGSNRPSGHTGRTHTGFLVVRGAGDAESLEDLAALEIPESVGDGLWLVAWCGSLPDSLHVSVLVSRSFDGTWDDVQARKQVTRERQRGIADRSERNRIESNTTYLKAEEAVERHGLSCSRHYPRQYRFHEPQTNTDQAYVILNASELYALLEKLDPQRLLDKVSDDLAAAFAPVVHESTHEALDMIEYVQRYVYDVLKKK